MPDKDGLEMIQEFKRLNFEAKIIAMSGGGRSDPQDYLKVARAFGALRVLAKPFSHQEILETVSQMLQGITLDVIARERAEEEFRRLIEGAPNGMVVMDQKGKIMLVNAKIEEAFGYGSTELVGQPIRTLAAQRFHENSILAIASLRFPPQGEWVQAETLYALRKDGSEFPVEIRLNRLQTDQGVMVLGTIVDITERKRAEEILSLNT
jgi:PAS domain S-box-containing protein